MKSLNGVMILIFIGFWNVAIARQGSDRNPGEGGNARVPPAPSPREIMDSIVRAQGLAEQGQAELKRLSDQNDSLRQMLELMQRQMIQLREEVNQLRSGASSPQRTAVTGSASTPTDAGPQTPITAMPASLQPAADLSSRLSRIQDQVEINSAQIREQAQTKVESDSRLKVKLFGMVLNNTYFNTADSSEQAVPTFARPASASVADRGDNFGSTLRQTTLGLAMTGPRIGAAKLSADVDFDFYGGAPGAYGADMLGALRFRTASVRLDGTRSSIVAGLRAPMISPLNPTSLASVYYSALGDSGNLWQWRPQIEAEHRSPIGEANSLIVMGGLMMPFGENFYGKGLEGKPGYESRVAFSHKLDPDRRMEIGTGGYFHPQQFGFGRTVNSYAMAGDWLIPIGRRLEFSGEAYYGQSITLSEQGGADISPDFSFNGSIDNPATIFGGIRSAGGWAQLHAQVSPRFELNAAFGLDDPRNRDVFRSAVKTTTRLRNQTLSSNFIYRMRSNFLVSLEYRRVWTDYPATRARNDHFNLALGYAF